MPINKAVPNKTKNKMTTLTNIIGSERGNEGRDNPSNNPVELADEITKRLQAESRQKEIEAKKAKLKQPDVVLEKKVETNPPKVTSFSDYKIIKSAKYLDAMIQAEKIAEEQNLVIASMPQLIQALTNPQIYSEVRPNWVSTNSAEYQGQNIHGEKVYVVAHGLGPLSNANGLKKYLPLADRKIGFMQIESADLKSVLKNAVSISDVRKENLPKNKNYSIIINLDKDIFNFNERGLLSRHNFLTDDRVLAVCGSLENRETLANIIFKLQDKGREDHSKMGSFHRIKEFGFNAKTSGRPLCLDDGYSGLNGLYDDCSGGGRFVLVAPEAHKSQNFNFNLYDIFDGK